jgi:hypothetical protein
VSNPIAQGNALGSRTVGNSIQGLKGRHPTLKVSNPIAQGNALGSRTVGNSIQGLKGRDATPKVSNPIAQGDALGSMTVGNSIQGLKGRYPSSDSSGKRPGSELTICNQPRPEVGYPHGSRPIFQKPEDRTCLSPWQTS